MPPAGVRTFDTDSFPYVEDAYKRVWGLEGWYIINHMPL